MFRWLLDHICSTFIGTRPLAIRPHLPATRTALLFTITCYRNNSAVSGPAGTARKTIPLVMDHLVYSYWHSSVGYRTISYSYRNSSADYIRASTAATDRNSRASYKTTPATGTFLLTIRYSTPSIGTGYRLLDHLLSTDRNSRASYQTTPATGTFLLTIRSFTLSIGTGYRLLDHLLRIQEQFCWLPEHLLHRKERFCWLSDYLYSYKNSFLLTSGTLI
jgi:hypothetical protein